MCQATNILLKNIDEVLPSCGDEWHDVLREHKNRVLQQGRTAESVKKKCTPIEKE